MSAGPARPRRVRSCAREHRLLLRVIHADAGWPAYELVSCGERVRVGVEGARGEGHSHGDTLQNCRCLFTDAEVAVSVG